MVQKSKNVEETDKASKGWRNQNILKNSKKVVKYWKLMKNDNKCCKSRKVS